MVGVVRDLDAEREQRDAQERYQFVIEATGAGVSDWEPGSDSLYWNGPLRAMLDLDPHAPASIGWLLTRVHPDDAARVKELLADPPTVFEEEIRVRGGSGACRYLLCTGRAPRDDAGGIGRVSVVAQDVTALRRAQRDRVRLVRELHDSVAEELTAAITHVEGATPANLAPEQRQELFDDLAARLRRGNEHMRMLLRTLRAVDGGPTPSLEEVLTQLVSMYEEHIGVPVQLDVARLELSPAETQAAFAITREALNNVSKHAGASRISVTVQPTRSGYELVIADNGRGFWLSDNAEQRVGLAGMRERASDVGGRLDVSSRPGSGTRISLRFTNDGPS
jgi:two-component sensor histidine kinase